MLCDPPDTELAVELARRGYRLLVLHDGGFPVSELRQMLRDQGLQSQLMGAHACPAEQTPSLPADFYELWLCCGQPRDLTAAALCLRRGALLLWLSDVSRNSLPGGMRYLTSLPEGVAGGVKDG